MARATERGVVLARWKERVSAWDMRAITAVRDWRRQRARLIRLAWLDRVMQGIARYGSTLFFLEMVTLLAATAVRSGFGTTDWMHAAAGVVTAVVAGFGSKATVDALAHTCGRVRPFVRLGYPPLVAKDAHDPSFPSNHAGGAFALATVLSAFFPGFAIASFALATVLAFSRLYALLHYPSDLVAGAVVGTLIGLGCVAVIGLAWP